jgi:hypothetical protein
MDMQEPELAQERQRFFLSYFSGPGLLFVRFQEPVISSSLTEE